MKLSTLFAMANPIPKHSPNKKSATAFCMIFSYADMQSHGTATSVG